MPHPVVLELDAGRLLRPDTIDPRTLDWITQTAVTQSEMDHLPPNRLGYGERAVIAYAYAHSGYTAGLDDLQARLLAERLGTAVIGTIGILIRAKEADLIPLVRPHMNALQRQGFRISLALYDEVLRLAGEDDEEPKGST
ncbi:MAG: DUF3368 domain-containing protein [Chloroflexi bacterium]|nr:DUF3368 domain-containing protein [Chloroflexota bacterium]